jgi:hypothetical protein
MQRELTLANQVAILFCEALGVGLAVAAFIGWWVATP